MADTEPMISYIFTLEKDQRLILSIKDERVEIVFCELHQAEHRVRLGFIAPRNIPVFRSEVLKRRDKEEAEWDEFAAKSRKAPEDV